MMAQRRYTQRGCERLHDSEIDASSHGSKRCLFARAKKPTDIAHGCFRMPGARASIKLARKGARSRGGIAHTTANQATSPCGAEPLLQGSTESPTPLFRAGA